MVELKKDFRFIYILDGGKGFTKLLGLQIQPYSCTNITELRFTMKKNIGPKILLGIGIVLLICYAGGIFYFYNIQEYNPYASAGADLDALIHSALFLPPTVICLIASLILHIRAKK